MAVAQEQVLPGFRRSQKVSAPLSWRQYDVVADNVRHPIIAGLNVAMQSQGASPQQLPAGAFYRELLDTAKPEAATQVPDGTQRTTAAAPAAPAPQHGSTTAGVIPPGRAQQAWGLQAADGAATTAADPADADATAGLGSVRRIEIRQPVGRGEPANSGSAAGTAFVGPSLDYGISAGTTPVTARSTYT